MSDYAPDVDLLLRDCLQDHARDFLVSPLAIDRLGRRSRSLRLRRVAGIGLASLVAATAVGAVAVGVVDRTTTAPHTVGTLGVTSPSLDAQVRVTHDTAVGVTCASLYFPETGVSVQAGCDRLNPNAATTAAGIVSSGGGADGIDIGTGHPAGNLAVGEFRGRGKVTVTGSSGRRYAASTIPGPAGYPYAIYAAFLGADHTRTVTYSSASGAAETDAVPSDEPRPELARRSSS